jgi:ADP-heptose:LPS heptosyltransferase
MGPCAAIRLFHRDAEITLLTSAPYAELARAAPYFDRIWIDKRPSLLHPLALWRWRRSLRDARFARIYDLQTSQRSSWYFHLIGKAGRPEWSGIARGASHPHDNPQRDRMHTLDRQAEQLARAGITSVPAPDFSWAKSDLAGFALPQRFLLLVPGGAAHRQDKRWPIARFAAIAAQVAARGVTPVILGGPDEAGLGAAILASCPQAIDLIGRTSFADIVTLGATAVYALGNDTGPMHLIVAGGAAATVLYSRASDPALTAPRGPRVTLLRRADLADLTVAEVAATLALG